MRFRQQPFYVRKPANQGAYNVNEFKTLSSGLIPSITLSNGQLYSEVLNIPGLYASGNNFAPIISGLGVIEGLITNVQIIGNDTVEITIENQTGEEISTGDFEIIIKSLSK